MNPELTQFSVIASGVFAFAMLVAFIYWEGISDD